MPREMRRWFNDGANLRLRQSPQAAVTPAPARRAPIGPHDGDGHAWHDQEQRSSAGGGPTSAQAQAAGSANTHTLS